MHLAPLAYPELFPIHLRNEEFFGEFFPCSQEETVTLLPFVKQLAEMYGRKLKTMGYEIEQTMFPAVPANWAAEGLTACIGFKMKVKKRNTNGPN